MAGRSINAFVKILQKSLPKDTPSKPFRLLRISTEHLPMSNSNFSVTLRFIGRCFNAILSPSSYSDYKGLIRNTFTNKAFIFWFLVAMIFCFFGNAALSCTTGTLMPPQWRLSTVCPADIGHGDVKNRLYFLEDYWDLFLYVAVVPLYVALDIRLILIWIRYWNRIHRFASTAPKGAAQGTLDVKARSSFGRLSAGTIIASLGLTFAFISFYINEILSAKIVPDYWFVTVVDQKYRVLNAVGAYYLLMNAGLLLITFLSFSSSVSLGVQIIKNSQMALSSYKSTKNGRARLSGFRRSSLHVMNKLIVLLKSLILVYAINIFVWAKSPLGNVLNAAVSISALTLINLVVVPFPRLYVEDKIHSLGLPTHIIDPDTRSFMESALTTAIDTSLALILGACWVLIVGFNILEPLAPLGDWLKSHMTRH